MDRPGDARPDRRGQWRSRRRARSLNDPGCLHIGLGADGVEAELVADRCWLLGATAIGEIGSLLEVGFASVEDASAAADELSSRWPDLDVVIVDAGPALDAALDAWKPYARPLRVGPLHVRPAWLAADEDPPGDDEVVVVVDPSRSFGYDHPSTVLCLEAVVELVGEGRSVLDVGCGSGVLAVSAAKLGAGPVVALDVDAVAVAVTRAAASTNGVAIEVSTAEVGEERRTFDLVLANIGPAVLADLAGAIAARVAPGGSLVLAGIFAEQLPGITGAYVREGLEPGPAREREGWVAPFFLRKSTFSAP